MAFGVVSRDVVEISNVALSVQSRTRGPRVPTGGFVCGADCPHGSGVPWLQLRRRVRLALDLLTGSQRTRKGSDVRSGMPAALASKSRTSLGLAVWGMRFSNLTSPF